MTLTRKCDSCNSYTLKDLCDKCGEETKDPHYKFIKLRTIEDKEEDN